MLSILYKQNLCPPKVFYGDYGFGITEVFCSVIQVDYLGLNAIQSAYVQYLQIFLHQDS